MSTQSDSDRRELYLPVPHDVKLAIEFMRTAVYRPVSMTDLVQHCGVAERTLNNHFRTFLNISPMRYLRRLRLAAARESLLAGESGISVTEVAMRYEFNHAGRFADQYRRCFGESPSKTLRQGRQTAALSKPIVTLDDSGQEFRRQLPSRDKPSIAVLPCLTPTNEPALHWVAESFSDAISSILCSISSLDIKVPKSSRATIVDSGRLARELNARYFLTGRMIHVGSRLRVIFRLVDTSTGHHVWGDIFDGEHNQPLELQDRIIARVVRVIMPNIRGAEIARARRTPPQNLSVYGLAMRALPFVFSSQPESTQRALEFLNRAIEIDPDYGLATALAAWCHGQLVMYNGTPAPAKEKLQALQLVQRASILDNDDPLVLTARSAVHTMTREFDVAEVLLARTLALDPYSGWAWGRSGWLHSYQGKSETAIKHFGRALALDPNTTSRANNFIGIGTAHFNAGRYAAAAFWLQKGLLDQPGMWWANRSLAVSHLRSGNRLKALESIDTLRRFNPDLTINQVVAAVPFGPDFLDRLGEGLNGLGLPP